MKTDTPETDAISGATPLDHVDNLKRLARKLEREKADVIRALEIKARANEDAARRSPDQATWSNGVARGMREAIALLSNGSHEPCPTKTKE